MNDYSTEEQNIANDPLTVASDLDTQHPDSQNPDTQPLKNHERSRPRRQPRKHKEIHRPPHAFRQARGRLQLPQTRPLFPAKLR